MTTLYGIKNCDTVKKARKWLDNHGANYLFHDFRGDGLSEADLERWNAQLSAQTLINRRSTTWKQLDESQKAAFEGETLSPAAKATVLSAPTLLKRPVLEIRDQVHVGFKPDQYAQLFA